MEKISVFRSKRLCFDYGKFIYSLHYLMRNKSSVPLLFQSQVISLMEKRNETGKYKSLDKCLSFIHESQGKFSEINSSNESKHVDALIRSYLGKSVGDYSHFDELLKLDPSDLTSSLSQIALNKNKYTELIGNLSNTVLFRNIVLKGGRKISIVNPVLGKDIQSWIVEDQRLFNNIIQDFYERFFINSSSTKDFKGKVTGFIKGMSYLSHVESHMNSKACITMDISKFYNSITLDKMWSKQLFHEALKASFECETGLPFEKSSFDDEKCFHIISHYFSILNVMFLSLMSYYTHNGMLPTGAPYSPSISNLLFAKIDKNIIGYANSIPGVKYTRYADDICISCKDAYNPDGSFKIGISNVKDIESFIRKEGFFINYDKTKIMGPKDKKVIAGVIIDQSGDSPKMSIGSSRKVDLKNKYEGKSLSELDSSDIGLLNWVKTINASQYQFIVSGMINDNTQGA